MYHGRLDIVVHHHNGMVVNPLSPDTLKQAQQLLSFAQDSLTHVPDRLIAPVQDIIDTVSDYMNSDEDEWSEYRVAVPFENVNTEFIRRLRMWRLNTTVSFQDDEAPHLTMTQRALGTLSDGDFKAELVAQESGICVKSNADDAIAYLDAHFLAHPYSAIKGDDGSVVFTILDSGYYPVNRYGKTEVGTSILSVDDLAQGIVMFAESNPTYADHLRSSMGDLYAAETFHAEEYVGGFGNIDAKTYGAEDIDFGISGFGNIGEIGLSDSPPPQPTVPVTPAPPAPSKPTPSIPATPASSNPYGDKKSIPAKKVTDLPAPFLEKVRAALVDLPPELAALGQIGPRLTKFDGIEPCPPCHIHIPAESEDEVGQCIDMCEEHETCNAGVCEEHDDPDCKPTMRVEIGGGDRMCRVDSFNEVNANASNDDGFTWSIAGQKQVYSTIVYDRYVSLNVPMLRKVEQESFEQLMTNYTAGSAQPRPRKVSPYLMKGKGYRIPCPTANANPVKVHVTDSTKGMKRPTQFQFFKDSADNLYLECLDLKPGEMFDGTFIVELEYPKGINQTIEDKVALYSLTETFADLKSKVGKDADLLPFMPPLNAVAQNAADLVLNHISAKKDFAYTMGSPIGEVLQHMVVWLDDWSCVEIPRNKSGISTTQLYLNTESGSCRHRAYLAFLALNRLGLPTRFCGSTCHAWPEVWDYNNRIWVQFDLGGCGDPPPPQCPPCHKLNPMYGVNPDEPLCLPIECPEGYYCHPEYNKCIPDCNLQYPDDPDYHYNPDSGLCEKCPDGRLWNPILNVCECDDCPDGYSMVQGKCQDEDGNVSEDAPLGFYSDPITNMCLPIPDCSNDRPGSVFDMATGQCICENGPNPLDEEAPAIPYSWSDVHNQCMPDYTKVCGENEYWDEESSRCRTITESIRKILDGGGSVSTQPDDVEVENLIMEEGKARVKQSGFINPTNGQYITLTEMRQQGSTESSLRSNGYTATWETVSVAKPGLNTMNIPNILQGLLEWIEKQDNSLGNGKVIAIPLWNSTKDYRLVFKPVEGEEGAFNQFVETWVKAIGSQFPTQFTLNSNPNAFVIEDTRTA